MTETLPTPIEYQNIKQRAEMYYNEVDEKVDGELGLSIDFPTADESWGFRVRVYERDGDRTWNYQGTQREMEESLTP